MESVEIELEGSTAEECTCEPFTVVRYRDPRHEPSIVYGVEEINYYDNDDWLVLIGKTEELGEVIELFVTRQNEVLSVERIS